MIIIINIIISEIKSHLHLSQVYNISDKADLS